MEQHQPSWIKLLFFFFDSYGSDIMKQVIVHHFAWLDVLQLMNFLIFILLSFFIRQLPSTLRKILIGTYLFIIGGIIFSYLEILLNLLHGHSTSWVRFLVHFCGIIFVNDLDFVGLLIK